MWGEIAMEELEDIIRSWNKMLREIQTCLIMHKIIHRLYLAPSKMARLKHSDSELQYAGDMGGALVHISYECEMPKSLWMEIKSAVTGVSQSPALCIPGLVKAMLYE